MMCLGHKLGEPCNKAGCGHSRGKYTNNNKTKHPQKTVSNEKMPYMIKQRKNVPSHFTKPWPIGVILLCMLRLFSVNLFFVFWLSTFWLLLNLTQILDE